jgi:endoglucanase
MTDTPTLDAFLADIAALKARNAELEAEQPPAPAPEPTGFFGRPLSPVCLNIADGAVYPHVNYKMPSRPILEWAASLGVNAVRVAFRIEALQASPGAPFDGSRVIEMDAVLDAADKLGIGVMWDAHQFGDAWGAPITQGDLVEFWSDFADAFQGHPALLGYGLMNEPPADISGWPETCQACVDTIREVDEQTLIMVPGRGAWTWNWTQINNTMDQVKDPSGRMCHEAHQYADSDSSGRFAYSYEGHEWPRWTREMGEGNQLDWLTAITKPYHSWLKERGVRGILGETGIPSSCMWRGDLNAWAPHWDYRDGWLGMLRRYVTQAASDGVPVFLWTAGQHYAENKLVVAYDAPAGVANPVVDLIRELNAALPRIV